MGDLEAVALKRTGALPVSYIPVGIASTEGHEKTAAAETTAYDYFARLGDPNLVRVVQYAGAYQIFRQFGAGAETPSPPTAEQTKAVGTLREKAYDAMQALRLADATRQLEVADRLAGPMPPPRAKIRIQATIRELKELIAKIHESWGDDGLRALAARLADPREVASDIEKIKAVQARLEAGGKIGFSPANTPEDRAYLQFAFSRWFSESGMQRLLAGFADIEAVKRDYSAAFPDAGQGWIRTPSIVVSQATGELSGMVGGHNLDAKVSEFRAGKVEPGKVNLVRDKAGKLVVEYNEVDRAKIPEIVRRVGKEADNPRLQSLVEGELKTVAARTIREPNVALYPEPRLETGGAGGGRGYSRTPAAAEPSGWEPGGSMGSKGPNFLIRRRDGKFEVTTSDGEVFLAHSRPSRRLHDHAQVDLGAGEKFHMEFIDFSPDEVANTLKSCQTRAARLEQVGRRPAARACGGRRGGWPRVPAAGTSRRTAAGTSRRASPRGRLRGPFQPQGTEGRRLQGHDRRIRHGKDRDARGPITPDRDG